MGDAHDEGYAADGETPVHEVELSSYWMDATAVTNAQFARFVRETGHVTEAEQLGISAVFHLAVDADRSDVLHRLDTTPWWVAVRGADWRHPGGPRSSVADLRHHPVVHVTWNDASAYAAWVGARLPTEAEWERAARGGIDGARYSWGSGEHEGRLNIWRGEFPRRSTDRWLTTAPVKTYRPNAFGLWNMTGNVWEWCSDRFAADYYRRSPEYDPPGPVEGESRVMRGGSYLCDDSYCHRYRVAARSSNTPDSASANVGFRCANDA